MHQVILPQNFVDRHGRRVLADDGLSGRDRTPDVGSTTEQAKLIVGSTRDGMCAMFDVLQDQCGEAKGAA